jgi:hypothetical protein
VHVTGLIRAAKAEQPKAEQPKAPNPNPQAPNPNTTDPDVAMVEAGRDDGLFRNRRMAGIRSDVVDFINKTRKVNSCRK